MTFILVSLSFLFVLLFSVSAECELKERYRSGSNTDYEEALQFLKEDNEESLKMSNKMAVAEFKHQTDLTKENKLEVLKVTEEVAKFSKKSWEKATSFAWKEFEDKNETIYRWFKSLSVLGNAALPEDKHREFNDIIISMEDKFAKAKVCDYKSTEKCDLPLEPDVNEIMKKSRDYEELKHYWIQWRDVSGKSLKSYFLKYVDLSNEAACANGFEDAGKQWREEFDSEEIMKELDDLWESISPLYRQLHAYVRRKLIEEYGDQIKEDGPLPAHILGNMYAQEWSNIYDLVVPYPDEQSIDVSETMKEKEITVMDMFKMSEEFFTSLGLLKMTEKFWNRSVIEKPSDKDMVCHASAHDLSEKDDFRIKMCTKVDMHDFITIHHEMGHIQYYQQYEDQPSVFRSGANSGFHEAIGDALALSVDTPGHMQKIGLLGSYKKSKGADINELMKTALHKVGFIPYGYLIDVYRWLIFDKSFSESELNTQWWNLRLKYQGVCPPVLRTEEDLDAAAKYHVIADVPYIRYFISFIIQFQFHKALCEEAGHEGPLHECDIYQNKDAGKLMSEMMRLGSSVPWREAMKVVTKGKSDKMDASALLEYFQPLYDWLKEQNTDEFIGWNSDNPMKCP